MHTIPSAALCRALSTVLLLTIGILCGCERTAPPERVIHIATGSMVKTLDPALAEDLASRNMAGAIYDTLLEYDYVKRPYTLKPSMLEKMPEVLEDGRCYRFTLRDDLYFVPDGCFAEQNNSPEARKVRSSDVIFSLLRIADGKFNSPVFWLLRGKVQGIDEFYRQTGECASTAAALKLYEQPPRGFEIIDDRTFIIRLNAPDPRFLYNLAIPYTGIISQQAVLYYGQEAMAEHPVGSGPFKLDSFRRNYQIVLIRNDEYREEYFLQAENPADRTRRLPLADRIVCSNIRQNFTAWLLFLQGELDISALNKDNSDVVSGGTTLSPALRERQIQLIKNNEFEIQYIGFSFSDERLKNNLKLRQALTAAYNIPQRIQHANDLAIPAIGPIPPGVAGFDPDLQKEVIPYDLELAKKLLAEAGYPGGIDPATGQPLEITFDQSGNTTRHRQIAEMTAADWGKLGIKVTINLNNAPRFYQKLRNGEVQTFRLSWIGDYPDAENFLQLFYSRNAGGANRVGFNDPVFDAMFEKTLTMSDSPERTELYRRMAGYLVQQSPWIFESQPISFQLKHAWLENYTPHDFAFNRWKYWTVDNQRKKEIKSSFRALSFKELRE